VNGLATTPVHLRQSQRTKAARGGWDTAGVYLQGSVTMTCGTGDLCVMATIQSKTNGTDKTVVAFNGYAPEWSIHNGKVNRYQGGYYTASEARVVTRRWHRVAWIRWNGTGYYMVDGKLDPNSHALTHNWNGVQTVSIGRTNSGLYDPFHGRISDVMIISHPVKMGEIQHYMRGGDPRALLIDRGDHYWPIDGVEGTERDLGPLGEHMTVYGGTSNLVQGGPVDPRATRHIDDDIWKATAAAATTRPWYYYAQQKVVCG